MKASTRDDEEILEATDRVVRRPQRTAYDNPKTGPLKTDRQLPANLDGPFGPKQKETPPHDDR
jgi:hypothetical protein